MNTYQKILIGLVVFFLGGGFIINHLRTEPEEVWQPLTKESVIIEELVGDVPPKTLEEKIPKFLSDIGQEQSDYFAIHGRYFREPKTRNPNVDVFQYEMPNGEMGYQVLFYKTVGQKKFVKTVGYGPRALSKTSGDWFEIGILDY